VTSYTAASLSIAFYMGLWRYGRVTQWRLVEVTHSENGTGNRTESGAVIDAKATHVAYSKRGTMETESGVEGAKGVKRSELV
jgi:hypothetical protein